MQIPQNILDQLTPRDPSLIEYFVIHHTVTAMDLDIEQISQMDVTTQGFLTVGYNACIKTVNNEPILQFGRPLSAEPAAAYGINQTSANLAILGQFESSYIKVPFTPLSDELWSKIEPVILQYINDVKQKAPNLKHLIGHRDVVALMKQSNPSANAGDYSTLCPGDILYAKLDDLRAKSGLTKGF